MAATEMSNRMSRTLDRTGLGGCTALEYILLGDLRDLLDEPADEENRKWLAAVLDALLETLPRELELKGKGGYLSEVVEEKPNWSHHVDTLRREYDDVYETLRELRRHVSGKTDYAETANRLRQGLHDWMNQLTAYHRHENRLLQEALNMELGVGD